MADLGLHITLLPISRQALPSSAATCQNQLLVLQIGLCLFLYVFPVFELLSVLFCSVLLCLGPVAGLCRAGARVGAQEPEVAKEAPRRRAGIAHAEEAALTRTGSALLAGGNRPGGA